MDRSSLSDPFDFCLAQSLGAHRTGMARGDMTVAHARHLLETYPGLYRHAYSPAVDDSPRFARDGFACGDGWFSILDKLSAKLVADPNLVVVQCKEKIGILAMYFEDGPATITMYFDGGATTLVEAEAATEVFCNPSRPQNRREGFRRHLRTLRPAFPWPTDECQPLGHRPL